MASPTARPMLLDVPVGLVVGWVLWVAAQWPRLVDGPGPRRGEGPWAGPPDWEVGAFSWAPVPFVLGVVTGLCLRRMWPRVSFVVVTAGGIGYLLVGGSFGPALRWRCACTPSRPGWRCVGGCR